MCFVNGRHPAWVIMVENASAYPMCITITEKHLFVRRLYILPDFELAVIQPTLHAPTGCIFRF